MRKTTDTYEIKDFFQIESKLPTETRNYIYRMIAYQEILHHPYYQLQIQKYKLAQKYFKQNPQQFS